MKIKDEQASAGCLDPLALWMIVRGTNDQSALIMPRATALTMGRAPQAFNTRS